MSADSITSKDFSFLLRKEIYHPLSQLEISPAFRSPFPSVSSNESLAANLSVLDSHLKDGRFLLGAHLSAELLSASIVKPTDYNSIFSLLYTRLACLELTGNTLLAAQEAKALEDLNSSFYYVDPDLVAAGNLRESVLQGRAQHIVPWPLRVLAVRLQSIGFGDARRGIAGLYELGLEARKQLFRKGLAQEEKDMWKARLADLGIRVVNSLIDMGDLDAARRSLANLNSSAGEDKQEITRMVLLLLKIGDIQAARSLLAQSSSVSTGILDPLLSMAEGRYDDAIEAWRALQGSHSGKEDEALIAQNLAVCLLYTGKLNESHEILEALVENNGSFQSLTFNLATLYELSSDKSRALKLELTERIAKQPYSGDRSWERPNADFKI